MKPISVHEYLWDPASYPAQNLCVVFGNEPFLKTQCVLRLRQQVLDGEDAGFSLTRFEGDNVKFITLLKEVATQAMFGGNRRCVLLENADGFLTKYRDELEKYAEKPSAQSVLVILLQSFPANTNFYKKVVKTGLVIEAKALPDKEVPSWIARWSKHQYKTPCLPAAAALLLERVGPEHGLLDQELAKLSLMVAPKESITPQLVEQAVGSWRSQSLFYMLDMALAGKTAEALRQLDRLLLGGETVVGILNRIAGNLRMFATATRLILDAEKANKKLDILAALKQAGGNPYFLKKSGDQLKMLGRHRGEKLFDWILQLDRDLKGDSRTNPRLLLETLLVKLANPMLRVPKT